MGQKTNPIGNRLGYIRGWDSNWYGGKDFGDKLAEDYKIRKYLGVRLSKASVARISIERTPRILTITIHTTKIAYIIFTNITVVITNINAINFNTYIF